MSRGEMFQEQEEKRRQNGFFPTLYKAVVAAMGEQHDSPPIPAWIDDWQQGENRWKAMEEPVQRLSVGAG